MRTRNLRDLRMLVVWLGVVCSVFTLDAPAQLKYNGGTGDPNAPYQIATAEQMNAIGADPNDWDKHFQLTNDIDLGVYEGSEFNIIAPDPCTPFCGSFDGAGHTISNFSYFVERADDVGLFGVVADPNAQIKNVTLDSPTIEVFSGMYTGSLAGHLRQGTLVNCHAREGHVDGMWHVGGLVGGSGYVEAAPGMIRTAATIINCSYHGEVRGGFTMIGGLTGNDYGSNISNCFASGTVTGQYDTGGLAGNAVYSRIVESYSTCTVTGSTRVSGLVGKAFAAYVIQCYASGPVVGSADIGGLITDATGDSTTIQASFWDEERIEQTTNSIGEGKTTAEMQEPQTFIASGWDFIDYDDGPSDVWARPETDGYPILWWQVSELPVLDFSAGTGTKDDPYLIATAEQLNNIGHNPRLMNGHFRMTTDIDLANLDIHLIGSEEYPFRGILDGGGFTVSNFTYKTNKSHAIGLIRVVDGNARLTEIRNLGLIDTNVEAETAYRVGSLVGSLGAGRIQNCYARDGHVLGIADVGGLVGLNGMWDKPKGERSGQIVACWASMTVAGRDFVGGLIGTNSRGGTVTNCYADSNTSGLVSVGGLAGVNTYAIVANCYSVGMVSAQSWPGGLVGRSIDGTVCCSFWNTETAKQTTSEGGTGSITTEMQTGRTYLEAGWDFVDETDNGTDDLWWIDEGQGYPRLWWESGELASQ